MNWQNINIFLVAIIGFLIMSSFPSCTHDAILVDDNPIDTTGNNDTTVIDPGGVELDLSGVPCDSTGNTVYFENDVFPIIKKNCAISGCHGGGTYEEGVNLESYNSIINSADVRPFNLNGSDLYEVITETDTDKRMPPLPNARLTTEEINTIGKWIGQGAKNDVCNPNYGKPKACDSENVTYSGFVKSIITNNCVNCHKNGNVSGGVRLDTYSDLLVSVNNGKFFGAINWENGYVKMPFNQKKLDTCTINKIENWINNGAKNN